MVNINFLSIPGHCNRKYNEMKNDFLSMTRPFLAKMLMSADFLAGHIPCSLNAKDVKCSHFVYSRGKSLTPWFHRLNDLTCNYPKGLGASLIDMRLKNSIAPVAISVAPAMR